MSAAAATAGKIPKPQLRNLLQDKIKKVIIGASISSLLTGIAYKYGVMEPRRQQYAEFYKTYDPEARIRLMCKHNLLQACSPEYEKLRN